MYTAPDFVKVTINVDKGFATYPSGCTQSVGMPFVVGEKSEYGTECGDSYVWTELLEVGCTIGSLDV